MAKKLTHVHRALTDDERAKSAAIRAGAEKDFPPRAPFGQNEPPPGIPARIAGARAALGLTRYAVGELAKVPSVVVRDIEQGRDVPLSQLQAVAAVLGLVVELADHSG